MVDMDLDYAGRLSMTFDFRIILRTMATVPTRRAGV